MTTPSPGSLTPVRPTRPSTVVGETPTLQVPDRLSLALVLIESSVEAVEGRLKNPVKKQGVICRTLLKALLMECFAWLPPRSFPQSSVRLFKVTDVESVLGTPG